MEAQVINIIHTSVPFILVVAILWGLGGWFYTQVLGKEMHKYIVFSVIIALVFVSFLILTNRDIQRVFFG